MSSITVRNLPLEVHRALRVRAARHGRSTEAEVRTILAQAAKPEGRVKLGTLLGSFRRDAGLRAGDADVFEGVRDKTPVRPPDIE